MPGCEVGWFQKGHKPINILPIGHIRKTKDGYFEIKINTTGYKPNDWVAIHRLVYERMTNKPIPPNHVIIFLDGNQENYDPTNLKCITKKENMIRNSMHQYGPVYVKLKQLEGAITRQINLKEKQHEHSTNAL